MKGTHSSVTKASCTCGTLERLAEDPDHPFSFDGSNYVLQYYTSLGDGTGPWSMMLYHCPFCGGVPPTAQAPRPFRFVHTREYMRLLEIAQNLRSMQQVVETLGQPDGTVAPPGIDSDAYCVGGPSSTPRSRCFKYSRLSEMADVFFVEYGVPDLRFVIRGKPNATSSEPETSN